MSERQAEKEYEALVNENAKKGYKPAVTKPQSYDPLPSASSAQTPTPTSTKRRVYPDSMTQYLHPCTIQGEQVYDAEPPGGYFICGIAIDDDLRWLHDDERARAVAKSESDAFWAEHEAQKAAESDVNSSNNGYTGPRCYAPGGKTYKPC